MAALPPIAVALALAAAGPAASPPANSAPASAPVEVVYQGGVRGQWSDQGWGRRDTEAGRPARLDFSGLGGWRLVHPHLAGVYTDLTFTLAAPASFGTFLEVHLGAGGVADETAFAHVLIDAAHAPMDGAGRRRVRLPLRELNPRNLAFNRIELRAVRPVPSAWVTIDEVVLWGPPARNTGQAAATSWRRAALAVDCRRPAAPISPLIYGTAYNPQRNDGGQWHSRPSARRWGGSASSRFNWRLGNAWNLGSDWYFLNANVTGRPTYSWAEFLDENRRQRIGTAITMPTIGWVARDTTSYSYPVSVFGAQQQVTGPTRNIGNGIAAAGGMIAGADPSRTSEAAPPAVVGRWVEAIERWHAQHPDAQAPSYILDHEPSLWNSTHRDVHPQAVTYDELLQRTIAYGREIRRAAPQARIAGPAEWGWPAYFFSARDAEAGLAAKPDRRGHGDEPLLAHYLRRLAEHEEATGEKLLTTLDVHYTPGAAATSGRGERTDDASNQRRVRATRSLWDPSYVDEGWVGERVELLPRLRRLVASNYPGVELSLGEYNFGGERHISGGVAQAEVLGRLGQAGVHSAYLGAAPPAQSPVAWAFAAYRNYDGRGRGLLSQSLATRMDGEVSLFASRGPAGTEVVAVAVNRDPRQGVEATVALEGCGNTGAVRLFQYAGEPEGLHPISPARRAPEPIAAAAAPTPVELRLPPWSITVLEVAVGGPAPAP